MKLLELRPPREKLITCTSSLKQLAKPRPQPASSVTVESPAKAIRTFADRVVAKGPAGDWAADNAVAEKKTASVAKAFPKRVIFMCGVSASAVVVHRHQSLRARPVTSAFPSVHGSPLAAFTSQSSN